MSGRKQRQKLQTILHVNFELTGGRRNRRQRQPTPVLLPGKSHGQRILEGSSPESPRVGHNLAIEHTHSQGKGNQRKVLGKEGLVVSTLHGAPWKLSMWELKGARLSGESGSQGNEGCLLTTYSLFKSTTSK